MPLRTSRGNIRVTFLASLRQVLSNPKCVFCGCKKMTKAQSFPDFAQSFDTPPAMILKLYFGDTEKRLGRGLIQ